MTLYLTEKQVLNRYVDGLREASSRAQEMMRSQESDKPKILVDFIHAMRTSAGSAHQLAHSQQDHSTAWLNLRDLLEKIIEIGEVLPLITSKSNGSWLTIKQQLDQMIVNGEKLFTSKAFSRHEILDGLAVRQFRANDAT